MSEGGTGSPSHTSNMKENSILKFLRLRSMKQRNNKDKDSKDQEKKTILKSNQKNKKVNPTTILKLLKVSCYPYLHSLRDLFLSKLCLPYIYVCYTSLWDLTFSLIVFRIL